ncbi:sugar ABC transporter substrate-binding protein [Streptomyces sp. AD2-2]|nr:sugar ABC transporter substrate-binding protein [Streptomyces sp. AD2-2]
MSAQTGSSPPKGRASRQKPHGSRARHDVLTEVVRTTVHVGLATYAAQGGTPAGLTRARDPDVTAGSLRGLTERTAAVSELAATSSTRSPAGRDVQVGVIAGAPGAASDLLVGGFTKGLPANAKVVANQPAMFVAAKARTVAEGMIKGHPDLDYAFVANEEMAFAARKAFDAAGGKKVRIVTVNGTDEALAALKDGRFAASVSNSAKDTGELAVTNAISLLRKEKVQKIATTSARLITKGNADTAPLYCPSDGL